MARGAGSAPAGQAAPAADAGDGVTPVIPEKYRVTNEDGSVNWEASALKQAQGYAALSQRLGSGELPPKTADEYAPELPPGITMEAVKTDPLFAGFLKGAHAKGMNNAQVSYAITQFQQRLQLMEQQRNSPEVAEAELAKVWTSPSQMEKGIASSYRAVKTFADSDEHMAALEKKFGNDPDFIRFMAKVGAELGEDKPVQGLSMAESESLEALKAHPAYSDSRHPEHRVVTAKVSALYQRKYGA